MEKIDALKIIYSKIELDQTRWNSWTLFFFGLVISTFTLWGGFKDAIPAYLPFVLSTVFSLAWVYVSLGIRRFSKCWFKVLQEVEKSLETEFFPNELFLKEYDSHSFWDDFKGFSPYELTKVLTYLGILFFVIFFAGSIFFFNNPLKESKEAGQ